MALVAMVEVGLTLFTDMGIAPSIAQSKPRRRPEVSRHGLFAEGDPRLRAVDFSLHSRLLRCRCFSKRRNWRCSRDFDLLDGHFRLHHGADQIRLSPPATRQGDAGGSRVAGDLLDLHDRGGLAYTQSVLALVLGGLVAALAQEPARASRYLDGHRNRLRWDPSAARELIPLRQVDRPDPVLVLLEQGDKMVFSKFLTLQSSGSTTSKLLSRQLPLLLGRGARRPR
ncbi:MAG: hypothetical protein R3D59_18900 [Paracoccaceae bacterium]